MRDLSGYHNAGDCEYEQYSLCTTEVDFHSRDVNEPQSSYRYSTKLIFKSGFIEMDSGKGTRATIDIRNFHALFRVRVSKHQKYLDIIF